MDRLIYTAMSGARLGVVAQSVVANNIANVNTAGFRAQLAAYRAVPVSGEGLPTRAVVVESTPGSDFTPGAVQATGRDLDVAVQGRGWIAVRAPDGSEAYTRAGGLSTGPSGVLQTAAGLPVVGDGGTITLPPDNKVTIAADGTVSATANSARPAQTTPVGRIKLVLPDDAALVRGDDGLFRLRNGEPASADANVKLMPGALEGSNVNVVESMVGLITLARQFEMQMKMLQNAEANDRQAAQLLSLTR